MSAARVERSRTCRKCGLTIRTTAYGMKEHANITHGQPKVRPMKRRTGWEKAMEGALR